MTAFIQALERTQEILFLLHKLKREGAIPQSLPVYLDSPMGVPVTLNGINWEGKPVPSSENRMPATSSE